MSEGQGQNGAVRVRGGILAAIIIAILGALLAWGFATGRKEAAEEAERDHVVKAPLRVATKDGETVVKVDEDTQDRSGIETEALSAAPFQQQVRAYGMVLDIARLTDLANNYAAAKAALQTAAAKLAKSKPEFDRATQLYNDGRAVSEAQLQSAAAALATDQAGLAAAEAQIHTTAATAYQEWGAVLGKSLVEGQPQITRLIERQEFLLQITLPPGTVLASPPATAAIETGKNARAIISYVSQATRIDPKIQGVSFFYAVPAGSGVLPGMNVLAFLPSGKIIDGVTVPASAVVWWQDRAWVYRRATADSFARTEIATDVPAPAGGYVVEALPGNTEVVTSGAQLLLSEEFRSHIQVDEDD